MKEPMVIIENKYTIPADIISWAKAHSVPIIHAGRSVYASENPTITSLPNFQASSAPFNLQEPASLNLQVPTSESETLESNISYRYDYVIEYSEDLSIDYLNTAYCHAHNLPALIGMTEHLIIGEIGISNLDSYLKILETYPDAVSDISMLGQSRQEAEARHRAYMKYSYQFLGYGIWGLFYKPASPIASTTPAFSSMSASSNKFTERINYSQISDSSNQHEEYLKNSFNQHKEYCKDLTMIGIAGLDGTEVPSLSYAILPEYQGKGYVFEACQKIAEYAMDVCGLSLINISVHHDNYRSLKLAKKLKDAFPELFQIQIVNGHSQHS